MRTWKGLRTGYKRIQQLYYHHQKQHDPIQSLSLLKYGQLLYDHRNSTNQKLETRKWEMLNWNKVKRASDGNGHIGQLHTSLRMPPSQKG